MLSLLSAKKKESEAMDKKRHIHPWPYPPQKCKACGRLHQWGDLNSDGICIPCHLELLDEAKEERSLLYIVSDGKEG